MCRARADCGVGPGDPDSNRNPHSARWSTFPGPGDLCPGWSRTGLAPARGAGGWGQSPQQSGAWGQRSDRSSPVTSEPGAGPGREGVAGPPSRGLAGGRRVCQEGPREDSLLPVRTPP